MRKDWGLKLAALDPSKPYLSLAEYEQIAIKLVRYYAKPIANKILCDEDAVSFLIERLIYADASCDSPENIKRRRRAMIKYAILDYRKQNKKKLESVTGQETYEQEFYSDLLDDWCLSDDERYCLKQYYFGKMSDREISELRGHNRKWATRKRESGILKLRKKHNA